MPWLIFALLGASGPSRALEFSALNGVGNNLQSESLGAEGDIYIYPPVNSYEDGLGAMPAMPSARVISNAIGAQFVSQRTSTHSVAMLAWGQSVAHDVGDMHGNGSDPAHIPVPSCDGAFDAGCAGDRELPFHRGTFVDGTTSGRRAQLNQASSYIDASWLYHSRTVREGLGGRLALPNLAFPDEGPDVHQGHTACPRPQVGDPRAMENPGLVTMYLVFGREHNRICAALAGQNPSWGDERLYQEVRMRVIALVQKVTLEEYAPNLLGSVLKDDSSYDPTVDPRVDVLFATAAYRYGHSAVPAVYRVGSGLLSLRDGQFNPCLTRNQHDDVIGGMPRTAINAVDTQFVRDLRDFLKTGPSHNLGDNDLFSRNIQRGRDCGLPRFNTARAHLGLPRRSSFVEIAGIGGFDMAVALARVYDGVDDVDFYVGGLLEEKESEATGQGSEELGVTFATVIRDQFQRLRRGDRFWYEWQPELAAFVKDRTLQDIFQDNTPGLKLEKSPFLLQSSTPSAPCRSSAMLDSDSSGEKGGPAAPADTTSEVLFRLYCGHGVIMIRLFAMAYPSAIALAVFARHTPWGFLLHKLVGQMGAGTLIVNLVMIGPASSGVSTHAYLGFSTAILALAIAALGFILDNGSKVSRAVARCRFIFAALHKTMGYIALLLSPITMWQGFITLRPFDSLILESTPMLWYMPILMLIPMSALEKLWRRKRKEISWEEYTQLIKLGRQLVVVNNYIIDVEKFGDQHPGGKQILLPLAGTDATDVFYGLVPFKDQYGGAKKYAHTKSADWLLEMVRIGLVTDWKQRLGGVGGSSDDELKARNLKVFEMYLSEGPLDLSQGGTHKWFRFHATSPAFPAHSVTFVNPTTGVARDYSPVGIVIKNNQLFYDFIIKIYEKGEMTQWLKTLKKGDIVSLREPTTISLSSPTKHGCWQQLMAFVAGTGIAPVLNLLSKMTASVHEREFFARCRVVIVWWLPSMDDFFLNRTNMFLMMKQLRKKIEFRIQLTKDASGPDQVRWLTDMEGVTVGRGRDLEKCCRWGLEKLRYDPKLSARVFICGTPLFNDSVYKEWDNMGTGLGDVTQVL